MGKGEERRIASIISFVMNEELLKEYSERNIRWGAESLKQLSFYNNLLLTLGVGFLTFALKSYNISGLHLTIAIEWPITLIVSSMVVVVLSILTGLMIAITRLQDFRITRQVVQIRQRVLEHSGSKLDERTPDKFGFWQRIFLLFQHYPQITIEDCKKYKEANSVDAEKLRSNFRGLRNTSYNLGLSTWSLTKCQTVCFGLTMILYLTSRLLS